MSPPDVTTTDVVRGGVWVLASTVIPQAYMVVTSVAVARILGVEGVGRVAFIAFAETTLATILSLGVPAAYMRYVGETMGSGHPGMIRTLSRTVGKVVGACAVLGASILVGVAALGGSPPGAWLFAALTCSGAIVHSLPASFLIGMRRWRDANIVGVTSGAVGVALKVATLTAGGGVTELFAVDAVVIWCNVIGTAYLALRAARRLLPPAEPAGDLGRRALKFAAISSISLILSLVLYRRTEILFLRRYSTDREIALYSIPFSIVVSLIMLPRAIVAVIAPTVATLFGAGDQERIGSAFGRSSRIVLLAGVLATAGAIAIGPSLVSLLYGTEFEAATPVLVILLSTVPFVPLMAVAQSVLLGIGRQWVPTVIITAGVVVNLALDLALIPLWDANGAAVANSAAQIVAAVPLVAYTSHCVGGVRILSLPLLRGALAGVVAALAAGLTVQALPNASAVPLGALVFVGVVAPLSVWLRVLSTDDAVWLRHAIGPRLATPVDRFVRIVSRPHRIAEGSK